MLTALSQAERIDLLFSVNLKGRKGRRVKPSRVAELIDRAMADQSLDDIAADLELKSVDMLRRFLSLRKLPEEIQELVEFGSLKGRIAFSTAFQITRLCKQTDVDTLARATLENSLTKQEVETIIQRHERGEVSVPVAIQEVLRLRPIESREHLFVGLINKELLLEDLEDEEVRRRIRRAIANLIGGKNVISVSCRHRRFSLLISDEGVRRLPVPGAFYPDELEATVTKLVSGVCSV